MRPFPIQHDSFRGAVSLSVQRFWMELGGCDCSAGTLAVPEIGPASELATQTGRR